MVVSTHSEGKIMEVTAQCFRCHEIQTIEALIIKHRLVFIEHSDCHFSTGSYGRRVQRPGRRSRPQCHCGGHLQFFVHPGILIDD